MILKRNIVVFIFGVLMVAYGLLSLPDVQVSAPAKVQVQTSTDIIRPTKPLEVLGGEVKPQLFLVRRVIDGDTIELSNGQKVRYIGIDTPETIDSRKKVQCFGIESSEKNKELVEGKNVRLEKDMSETDKYGRLLRYVYVGDLFINNYLVEQGYAYASSFPPDIKYQSQFKISQNYAQQNNLGFWASCQ